MLLVASAICGSCLQVPVSAWAEAAKACGAPVETDSDWPTALPEEVGLDAARLCSIAKMLDGSPWMNVHAVVVVRGGKLVYETYRAGEDDKWGRKLGVVSYAPHLQHDLRSISKSVVSLLVGIALDRKLIASIDEPIFSYFPERAALHTLEKDRIQLSHLLTMSSGLAWDEKRPYSDPKNSEIMMIRSTDPYRFVLEQTVLWEPGKTWNYNGGNTQLLAGVVERTTGKWLTDFAKEALFEPLGITSFEWVKMPANGNVAAASGLRLRPRDMAKIGKLVLGKGLWNGRRVVSESWIRESTQGRFDVWSTNRYGYHWWVGTSTIGGRNIAWIAAMGLGGQRIYMVPSHDLVVVITAGLYASDDQDWVVRNIFENYALASIRR
jgi:CubicO group peptidase (beta-lactamase class C family)